MADDRLRILLEVAVGGLGDLGKVESGLKGVDQAASGAQKNLSSIGTSASNAISGVNNLGGAVDTLISKLRNLNVGNVFQGLSSATGTATTIFRDVGVAATAAGVPITMLATSGVKAFAELESQTAKNNALIEGTEESYQTLLDLSKSLAQSTPFNALEIAQGTEALAAAGYNLNEIQNSMETVTQMAMATGEPIQNMASILIGALSSFEATSDEAGIYGDKLAKIANISTASLEDIGISLRYTGSAAHAFNKDINEVGAALAVLANRNVKGSVAGTALNEMFARLGKVPKEAKRVLDEYGISIDEINPRLNSLYDILTTIKNAGITPEDMMRLFGLEAGPKMMALVSDQALKEYEEYYNELKNKSEGSLKEFADAQKNTLAFALDEISNSIDNIKMAIGEGMKPFILELREWFNENEQTLTTFASNATKAIAPLVEKFLDIASRAMQWFNGLPDDMQSKIASLAGLGGALAAIAGPLLLFASLPLGSLTKVFGALGTLFGGGAVVSGIGGAAADTALLATALKNLAGATGNFRIAEDVGKIAVAASGATAEVGLLGGALAALGGPVTAGVIAAIAVALGAYVTNFGNFRDNVNEVLSDLGSAVSHISTGEYREAGRACGDAFADGLKAAVELLGQAFNPENYIAVGDFLTGMREGINQGLEGLGASLTASGIQLGQELAKSVGDGCDAAMSYLVGVGNSIITSIWDGIQEHGSVGGMIADMISDGINNASADISSFVQRLEEQIRNGNWSEIGASAAQLVVDAFKMINPTAGAIIQGGLDEITGKYKENEKYVKPVNSADYIQNRGTQGWNRYASHNGPYGADVPDRALLSKEDYIESTSKGVQTGLKGGVTLNAGSVRDLAGAVAQQNEPTWKTGIDPSGYKSFDAYSDAVISSRGNLVDALEDWNNKGSVQAETTKDNTNTTRENSDSVKESSNSTKELIAAYQEGTSKQDALNQTLDRYGEDYKGKVTIGNREYTVGSTDGQPVLKASNDIAKEYEKWTKTADRFENTVSSFAAGTSFEKAIRETLDKYGSNFQGRIQIGNEQYSMNKSGKPGAYDAEGNYNEWIYTLKAESDSAAERIKALAKQAGMTVEEFKKAHGVTDGFVTGTETAKLGLDGVGAATDKTGKSVDSLGTSADTAGQSVANLEPPVKSAGEAVANFADQVGSIDLKSLIMGWLGEGELGEALARKNSDLGDLYGQDVSENVKSGLSSIISNELPKWIQWEKEGKNTPYEEASKIGSSLWYDIADAVLKSTYKGYNAPGGRGWERENYIDSRLTPDTMAIINGLFQKSLLYIKGIYDGTYTAKPGSDYLGNSKIKNDTPYWSNKWTLESNDTANAVKQLVPVMNSLDSSLQKTGMNGDKLTAVLNNVDKALSDHFVSLQESTDYLAEYNKAAGDNTKYTQQQENQTKSLMEALNKLNDVQSLYKEYMADNTLSDSEAISVKEKMTEVTKLFGEAGITATSDISGLPGALQTLASAAQAAMQAIQNAVASANTAVSNTQSAVANIFKFSNPYTVKEMPPSNLKFGNRITEDNIMDPCSFYTKGQIFASGGPVTQNGPAYLHQGEYVLRRDEVNKLTAGGTNVNLNINMSNSKFGNSELQRDLPKRIARETRRALARSGI